VKHDIKMTVNGTQQEVQVESRLLLVHLLRENLRLTGTHIGCDTTHCGACTVLLDGVPTLSCITLVHTVDDREVTTIEGLRDHPLVHAFVRTDAVQCGFCTPGQIVSAAALVATNPAPSKDEVQHAMSGNLCRCGTYPKIEEAITTWQD
jgi:carbon-monoxide dehydrogenase small subunit